MDTNKIVIDLIFIAIPIAAIIIFVSLSWKTVPTKCWQDLNGSKINIISSLRSCVEKCWSKHEFGKDLSSDDCYIINVFSNDYEIENKDIENIENYVVSYLDSLAPNTPYTIKLRYNSANKQIEFINVGYCGNNIVEGSEFCDGDDKACQQEEIYGSCTGDKFCFNCRCAAWLDCEKCSELAPRSTNSNTDNEWCRYCKTNMEINCNDDIDNDCDGEIDNDDNDCIKINNGDQIQFSTKLIYPVDLKEIRYSSCFGFRGISFHSGIDIALPVGTEIKAAADGKVVFTKYYNGWGNSILIEHNVNNKKIYTLYGHIKCDGFAVKEGDIVKQGQIIGYSGGNDDCKGYSTGPHLHFEVREDDSSFISSSVNPCIYIDCGDPCDQTLSCKYYKQYIDNRCDDPLT